MDGRDISFLLDKTAAKAPVALLWSVPQPSIQQQYYAENTYKISITGNYHSIGEMFAEFANFKYPTSIQKMNIVVSPNLKAELESADKHGTVPNTVATDFDFTTYTSRK